MMIVLIPLAEAVGAAIVATLIILHALRDDEGYGEDEDGKDNDE